MFCMSASKYYPPVGRLPGHGDHLSPIAKCNFRVCRMYIMGGKLLLCNLTLLALVGRI